MRQHLQKNYISYHQGAQTTKLVQRSFSFSSFKSTLSCSRSRHRRRVYSRSEARHAVDSDARKHHQDYHVTGCFVRILLNNLKYFQLFIRTLSLFSQNIIYHHQQNVVVAKLGRFEPRFIVPKALASFQTSFHEKQVCVTIQSVMMLLRDHISKLLARLCVTIIPSEVKRLVVR